MRTEFGGEYVRPAQLAGGCFKWSEFPSGGGSDDEDSDPRALPGLAWSRQRAGGLLGCVRMFRHLFFRQTRSDRGLGCIAASISFRRPFKCQQPIRFCTSQ
jgi:hypothetical protein